MFDNNIAPLVKNILNPVALYLVRFGVSSNTISIFGFSVGLLTLPSLYFGFYYISFFIIIINRVCDGLDGIVARLTKPTDRGAFIDISFDFIFYSLVPIGFALNNFENNGLAALILIFSFVCSGSTFLTYSLIAERLQMKSKNSITKGIFYDNGLMEGSETILFFLLFCMFPSYFALLAYLFSILCLITAIIRIIQGWRHFT